MLEGEVVHVKYYLCGESVINMVVSMVLLILSEVDGLGVYFNCAFRASAMSAYSDSSMVLTSSSSF